MKLQHWLRFAYVNPVLIEKHGQTKMNAFVEGYKDHFNGAAIDLKDYLKYDPDGQVVANERASGKLKKKDRPFPLLVNDIWDTAANGGRGYFNHNKVWNGPKHLGKDGMIQI